MIETERPIAEDRAYKPFELVTVNDVIDRCLNDFQNTSHRIILSTFVATYDEQTKLLFNEMLSSIDRDVEVGLYADEYMKYCLLIKKLSGSAFYQNTKFGEVEDVLEVMDQIVMKGSKAVLTRPYRSSPGILKLIPFAGRSHIKLTLADNIVYAFGNLNYHNSELYPRHDIMLRFEDSELSRLFEGYFDRNVSKGGVWEDLDVHMPGIGQVVIDGGRKGKSRIMQYVNGALRRDDISEVLVVTKNGVGGNLEKKLLELDAHLPEGSIRHYSSADTAVFAATRKMSQFVSRQKRHFGHQGAEDGKDIHANFIVVQYADGTHVSITGSCGFTPQGVLLGTAECALVSTNPQLAEELTRYEKDELLRKEPITA